MSGGILFQPGFFDEVVMREFVARFGETIYRPQPLYFYLPHLLHKFAPWSVLIIAIALLDLLLAALLVCGWLNLDVTDSVQARRSNFSNYTATVFAVGGANCQARGL